MSKFQILAEQILGRYQQAGFKTGDYVKLKSDYANHADLKGSPLVSRLKSLVDGGLNLKIVALKPKSPSSIGSGDVAVTSDLPFSWTADIAPEMAVGFHGGPDFIVPVPAEVLELISGEDRMPPEIPDVWKYKGKAGVEYPKTEL